LINCRPEKNVVLKAVVVPGEPFLMGKNHVADFRPAGNSVGDDAREKLDSNCVSKGEWAPITEILSVTGFKNKDRRRLFPGG
jgi:hypothetical protein